MNEFAYVATTSKTWEQTCIDLRRAVEASGWALLGGYDFGETLAAKGFPQSSNYKTFDICHAGHANTMLAADKLVSMCMPCSVVVFNDSGAVKVATVRPGMMLPALFGGSVASLHEYIDVIDQEIQAIVDAAVK